MGISTWVYGSIDAADPILNQLVRGGATRDSAVNRQQILYGAARNDPGWWVLSPPGTRACSLHDSGINHYHECYPRALRLALTRRTGLPAPEILGRSNNPGLLCRPGNLSPGRTRSGTRQPH